MNWTARRSVPVGRSLMLALVLVALAAPSLAIACSPLFEKPTIQALGPDQVVVIGTIGDKVPDGRLFHVERWFNGGDPVTPIIIAFKEGEATGDCSYPVETGQRLIIAPYVDATRRLSADLVTLQADPASEDGRRYVAEAEALFGPGIAPPTVSPATPAPVPDPGPGPGLASIGLGVAIVIAVLLVVVILAERRRPT